MGKYDSFDYPNTCPIIDNEISNAQKNIYYFLDNVIKELSPMIPDEERDRLAKDYSNDLYKDLEDIFENTRQSNIEMRDEAERQIKDLKEQIYELEN